jgi:hypothetical protein
MANTMTLIASSTAGSGGVSSISFTSIPSTYTDLKIVLSVQSNEVGVYFNGVTTNDSDKVLYYVGVSTVGSNGNASKIRLSTSPSPASTFGNAEVYIPNYLSSNFKSVSADSVSEDNGTTYNGMYLTAGLWSSTAAITSIQLIPSSGNLTQYSTAYLYGIKNS